MYRVELKETRKPHMHPHSLRVPNVPCGVESYLPYGSYPLDLLPQVPNVPCGVERYMRLSASTLKTKVPNVPCGVERT